MGAVDMGRKALVKCFLCNENLWGKSQYIIGAI